MLFIYLATIEDQKQKDKFTEIYNKYNEKIIRAAYKILGNIHDAEDAAQDAWFSIARNIDNIRATDENVLRIYIFKVLKNACYDIIEKKKRVPVVFNIDDFFDLPSDDSVEEKVFHNEMHRRVIDCIQRMPEKYRDVISMHYLQDLNCGQIADSLNRPKSTVKSQLQRGKKILKNIIYEVKAHDL